MAGQGRRTPPRVALSFIPPHSLVRYRCSYFHRTGEGSEAQRGILCIPSHTADSKTLEGNPDVAGSKACVTATIPWSSEHGWW